MAGSARAGHPLTAVAAALSLAAESEADGLGDRIRPRRRPRRDPATHPASGLRPGHRRRGNARTAVAGPHRRAGRLLPGFVTSVTPVTARLPGIDPLIAYSAQAMVLLRTASCLVAATFLAAGPVVLGVPIALAE